MTSRRSVVVAVALWLAFAALVWNVIFDRVIVLAGRRYSYDAVVLYATSGQYLHIDDAMRPAIAHGVRLASAVAGAIAIVSMLLIRVAAARDRRKQARVVNLFGTIDYDPKYDYRKQRRRP